MENDQKSAAAGQLRESTLTNIRSTLDAIAQHVRQQSVSPETDRIVMTEQNGFVRVRSTKTPQSDTR